MQCLFAQRCVDLDHGDAHASTQVQATVRVNRSAATLPAHATALGKALLAFSSPETKVLVTSQLLSGGGAMIEIEDSGIGIDSKDQRRVFRAFTQADPAAAGSGLVAISALLGQMSFK